MLDRMSQYGVDPTGRGAANMSALTVPQFYQSVHSSPGSEVDEGDTESHPATGGNPVSFIFVLIGFLVFMFILRRSSSLIQGETFGVNWFTFFQVGAMATAFILLLKSVFGRWHVWGITPAVAAI